MAVRPALFISYRRWQAAAVRPVVVALERAGVEVRGQARSVAIQAI